MACYFVEAAPHGDAVCTLMNLCLPAWEHMDREAEERMERHEAEGQSQASSRRRWQWDGGRWGEKEEEGEEMIEWKEGPLVAHVLHLLLPSFACQRLSQSPQTGKIQVFSLLCRYQEIIICCSVFHTDNQDNSEQDKLPHEGVKKKENETPTRPSFTTNFAIWDTVTGCSYNWFAKRISSIIYLLCQESRALILIVQGQIVKSPGLAPAVPQPIPRVFATVMHSCALKSIISLNLNCFELTAKSEVPKL